MASRALGAFLALAAAAAFVVSIATSAWWAGPPVVDGKAITAKYVHAGPLGATGCNIGGDGSCEPITVDSTVQLVGYAALAALAVAVVFLFILLSAAWRISDHRKGLSTASLWTTLLAAGGAGALLALGPGIKASQHVHVPIGWGTYVLGGGLLASMLASLFTRKLEPEPLRLKPSAQPAQPPPQQPVYDVREALRQQQQDILRPSTPEMRGTPGPQLRPLYDPQNAGYVPPPQAPPLPLAPAPMNRDAIGQLMGRTPPPALSTPPQLHAPSDGLPGMPPARTKAPSNGLPGLPPARTKSPSASPTSARPGSASPDGWVPYSPGEPNDEEAPVNPFGRTAAPLGEPPVNPFGRTQPPTTPPRASSSSASPPVNPLARAASPPVPPLARTAPPTSPPVNPLARTAPPTSPPTRPNPPSVPPAPPLARATPPSTPNPDAKRTKPASMPPVRSVVPPPAREPATDVEIDHEAKARAKAATTARTTEDEKTADDAKPVTGKPKRLATDARTGKNPITEATDVGVPPAPAPPNDVADADDDDAAEDTATGTDPATSAAKNDVGDHTAQTLMAPEPRRHSADELMRAMGRNLPAPAPAPAPMPAVDRGPKTPIPSLETPAERPATQIPISTAPSTLPPPKELDAVQSGPAPACPQCEAPMSWVDEHLRFYCRQCRMYF